ncbi:phosphoheptose isomerase family protein [Actinophytocola algeriensis]|uniref:SIS domain-containing protein n=1 Tax=Actinophytocola algeriensis TaxID=1768010 RepID=A0A7W7VFX0_9PSEU|nr:hypothetical protein [Actinophytocola algeriensis]MBB4908746.1 hypothetical protein [Actinophytocola algeriensis]MBE1474867.1 hypothetical protein [Actinophytocola algeriensis]
MNDASVGPPLAGTPYMELFHAEIEAIGRHIRDTQITAICAAMKVAYECQASGGRIFSHVLVGHFAMFAASPGIPGQPSVLPQRADRNISADYNQMKPGDFLLTNGASLINPDKGTIPDVGPDEARARGAYTVGITCSYARFYKTPIGAFLPVKMSTSLEQICDRVLDSGCTWSCGVISTPAIPEFKIISSSGLSQFLVYWACTAALCKQISTKGSDDGAGAAREYLDNALRSFELIREHEFELIDRVARAWTDRILLFAEAPDHPRLLVYGHPQAGAPYEGTQNMFVNEAYETAAGSMIMQPYDLYKTQLTANDIVLIGAISPDNSDEIQVAQYARQIGAMVVAFGPFDGNGDGGSLSDHVDVAINTHSRDGAGVLDIPGFAEPVCPISGLSGNLVLWLLTAQWTYRMVQRNQTPNYWQNYWEVGAIEYDDQAQANFLERGY